MQGQLYTGSTLHWIVRLNADIVHVVPARIVRLNEYIVHVVPARIMPRLDRCNCFMIDHLADHYSFSRSKYFHLIL